MAASYVYFVQPEGGGPIKIGRSIQPQKRISSLSCASPTPLELIATAPGGAFAESSLHSQFSDLRLHGEWFRPEPELLDFIREVQAGRELPDWDVSDGMDTFRDVILGFGSVAKCAADLGEPYQTVAAWFRRDSIPADRWIYVTQKASAAGIGGATVERFAEMAARKAPAASPSVAA